MKTRFEQIKEMNTKDMTKFLCRFTEAVLELTGINDICDYCPASKFCRDGHTGFEDWLTEEMSIKY